MKIIFTLLFFVVNCGLSAQYTITPSQKPAIGDTYNYIYLDTSNVINGSAGTNQVWNYANLMLPATPTVNSTFYSNATAVTNYSWYPGSYMAIIGPGGFTTFDSDPNNYSLNWIKTTLGGSMSIKYPDPLTRYHYPISFGSVFSDSVKLGAYDETPSGSGFLGPYLCLGLHSYTCTGSGTLNLPGGVSMPNTLKLNMVYKKLIVDPVLGDSTGYEYTEYEEYFNAYSKFPILAYTKGEKHYSTVSPAPPSHVYYKTIQMNNVAVTSTKDLEKTSVNVAVFPNPAQNFNIEIQSENSTEKPVFLLKNALGQEIEASINPISDLHFTLDMKNNIPGIYFLTMKTQNGQVTKKLLVE